MRIFKSARLASKLATFIKKNQTLVEGAFRDGAIKTTGTDIDKILPAVSRFGGATGKRRRKLLLKI